MIKSKEDNKFGYISLINGSLIEIKGFRNQIRIHDLVKISKYNILGEVIQIFNDRVVAQCYENTFDLELYEKVINLRTPLSMELAPGLLANIFDGIQRPLKDAFEKSNGKGFLNRGFELTPLSRTKKWYFVPKRKISEDVQGGDVIGTVQETKIIEHRIMVPPNISGVLSFIAEEGEYTIIEEIFRIEQNNIEKSFGMLQKWPITEKRPYQELINPSEPLITGIRVVDLLFPVAKGGAVTVPGGFGTGKTVIQQSIAKWCNADVIVFIGCGERGNEIADVLKEFSEIIDPKSGHSLLERTIIFANTSNMPVSAREASIFSGVTIAEYYRDMGYDVAVLADSTSRWAEALREISGLLEEMPVEEGYPAYLASRLSRFYERAGVVKNIGYDASKKEKISSLTIIGSISPPSGDFSEPVTSTTKRFVQAFWALDSRLAYSKHYPAIDWLSSYSNYPEYLSEWWQKRDLHWHEMDIDWNMCRNQINAILSRENDLKNITQLIGETNLPEEQQLTIFIAKLIRNTFLIQNAFDLIDCYTDTKKLIAFIKLILLLDKEGRDLLKQGFILEDIKELEVISKLRRINYTIPNDEFNKISNLKNELFNEINSLKLIYGALEKR